MMRKGITPVIAVVLLLLITVGAVTSAWGLYQQIAGGGDGQLEQLNQQQKAQSSDIRVQTVYKNDEPGTNRVNVSLRNTGSNPINLSEDVELRVDPDGTSEYLPSNLWDSGVGDISDSTCFSGNGEVLAVEGDSQEIECDTGVNFPDAGETVGFRVQYKDVESVRWDFSCEPSSGTATLC